ncbi:MAG TPA: enterochelin esterase, partial [Blastocatellia bacterium]|nr:enterochelin esterase [Blastocatellia bacterium]
MRILTILVVTAVLGAFQFQRVAAQDQQLTPAMLRKALNGRLKGPEADLLAEKIRRWFGKEALPRGATTKVDGLDVAWAIEVDPATTVVQVVSEDGKLRVPLKRVGTTNVYAATTTLTDGAAVKWVYEVGGKRIGGGNLEVYAIHPDTVEKPGVPKGTLTQQPKWKSKVFANTERDWWVYVPAQYKPESPACVMVFQDGAGMKNYVPVVLDNLIAAGQIPVIIGVFINPGTLADGRSNRSFEYDTLSPQYASFLLEEILPEVEKSVR